MDSRRRMVKSFNFGSGKPTRRLAGTSPGTTRRRSSKQPAQPSGPPPGPRTDEILPVPAIDGTIYISDDSYQYVYMKDDKGGHIYNVYIENSTTPVGAYVDKQGRPFWVDHQGRNYYIDTDGFAFMIGSVGGKHYYQSDAGRAQNGNWKLSTDPSTAQSKMITRYERREASPVESPQSSRELPTLVIPDGFGSHNHHAGDERSTNEYYRPPQFGYVDDVTCRISKLAESSSGIDSRGWRFKLDTEGQKFYHLQLEGFSEPCNCYVDDQGVPYWLRRGEFYGRSSGEKYPYYMDLSGNTFTYSTPDRSIVRYETQVGIFANGSEEFVYASEAPPVVTIVRYQNEAREWVNVASGVDYASAFSSLGLSPTLASYIKTDGSQNDFLSPTSPTFSPRRRRSPSNCGFILDDEDDDQMSYYPGSDRGGYNSRAPSDYDPVSPHSPGSLSPRGPVDFSYASIDLPLGGSSARFMRLSHSPTDSLFYPDPEDEV